MECTVRQATLADIPALQRLIPESVRVLSAGFYDRRQAESAITHIFGVDTQLIRDGTYYVVETAGQLIGCGGWSKRSTLYGGGQAKATEDPLLDPEKEPARIRAFFVHPDWARRGVGSRLMEACERAARQAQFKSLELVATLPGEPLYRSFGYETLGEFDIHLPDGLTLPVIRMGKRV
jgi:N-acetylglutamate synthase-like GNAT family acetyltransferase